MAEFSEVVKRLMEAKSLKQKDLADFIGINKQVVSNWFTKGYKPDLEHIPKLAEILGISTDDFFNLLTGKVKETTTIKSSISDSSENSIPITEAYQLQKKVGELQEQLIKYQAKEIEDKNRQIENKDTLRPDKDSTSITTAP